MEEYKAVLCHHGILGQRWGVRRFQNEDGSVTAAGRKRYQTGDEKREAKKEAKKIKADKKLYDKYLNEDGSLTKKGNRTFGKLIELKKEHDEAVKKSQKAANDEYQYMKNKGRGKGEGYKIEMQELYAEDNNFKPIADKRHETWKNTRDLIEKYSKEEVKVWGKNYNGLTVIGKERVEKVLNEYEKRQGG